MKIGIIGAGAMGCLYACLLSGKNEVVLLDIDRKTVEAINRDGIFKKEPDGTEQNFRIRAEISGEAAGAFDLLIVMVKDTATRAALSCNRGLISGDTVLLSLQNGMGNYEILQEFAAPGQILLGTTKHNCVTLGFGRIYHSGAGVTHIGSPSREAETAARIADAFRGSGIEAEECGDVKRLLWEKLFINMTINAVTALLDAPIGVIAEDAYAREVTAKLLEEAVAVAREDGADFDEAAVYRDVTHTAEILKTGKASMCQDMEKKRRTEIDFINGAVVRLGKKYGVETPYHAMITALIHAKEGLYERQ